jgi:hypothetical protein
MISAISRRSELSLFCLPNDVLILILEHLSLLDLSCFLKSVRQFKTCSGDSTSSLRPDLNLLQLFNHCGGHLFHRFEFNPKNLTWLHRNHLRVTKLKLQSYDNESARYVLHIKDNVQELDFHRSTQLLTSHNDESKLLGLGNIEVLLRVNYSLRVFELIRTYGVVGPLVRCISHPSWVNHNSFLFLLSFLLNSIN